MHVSRFFHLVTFNKNGNSILLLMLCRFRTSLRFFIMPILLYHFFELCQCWRGIFHLIFYNPFHIFLIVLKIFFQKTLDLLDELC